MSIKDSIKNKDYLILLAGFLGALKIFLASLGYDVIPEASIDSFVNMVGFGAALFATYKNTYALTGKAKRQKETLENHKDEWENK